MKNESVDRISAALAVWNTKEDELKKTFRNENLSNERHFMKDKMRHYIDLKRAFKDNVAPYEKHAFNTLKGEIKRIEYQLYPKRRQRLAARLGRSIAKVVDKLIITPLKNKFLNSAQSPEEKIYQQNQQTVKKDQTQNVKLNTNTIQQQKNQSQVQKNTEPLKNLFDVSLRNPVNENRLKNNHLNQGLERRERQRRHRLR